MAGNVYLSRFRASNFRAFGAVDIPIPAAPGLVLLEGPNGLGKTSWLEAVEWVLSGRVQRWARQDAEHHIETPKQIRRRGAPGGEPCDVALTIGEHTATWKDGDEPAAATWLCDSPASWSLRPDNLNGFLRGTHILPQSAGLRLLHLDAEERWKQILRVASGYSEIDDLSASLQGTKRPLTTEQTARADALREARSTLANWTSRVADLVAKRDRAAVVVGLVAPSHASERLASEDAPTSPDTEAGARELTDWLSGRIGAQRSERRHLEARRLGLTALVDLPVRWQAASAAVAEALGAVTAREADERRLREELVQRSAEEGAAAAEVAEASIGEGAQRRRLTDLVGLAEGLAALPAARAASATADSESAAAAGALTQALEHRTRAHTVAAERRAFEGRVAEHQRRIAALDRAARAWARIRERSRRHDALRQEGEGLNAAAAVTLTALDAARASLVTLSAESERALQLGNQVRSQAGELQSLVAALARHIAKDSVRCPLCLAEYPTVGALHERVEKARLAQGPEIALAERVLGAASAREAVAAREVEVAGEAHRRAMSRRAENQEELRAIEREITELRPLMAEIRQGNEDADLRALREALDSERLEIAAHPGSSTELTSVIAVQVDLAEEAVRRASARRVASQASAEVAATALAQLNNRVATLRRNLQIGDDEDLAALVAATRLAAAAAAEAVRNAKEVHAAATKAREETQGLLNAASAEVVRARVAQDERLAQQRELAHRWEGRQLRMPPSLDQLTAAAEELSERMVALDARVSALVAAVEGVGRWLDHVAVDAEASGLDAAAGGSGPAAWDARTQFLAGEVRAAELALTRARDVRDNIERMATSAEQARASMRADLEARLKPILGPMLRALVVDRTIAEAAIALAEQRAKTTLTATVGKEKIDLLALASEGQLSGVNLAVQLSMALAFRWSRWPAVLLDDPAQYSDVVHSTNLVETLRVLALHHGFQIFLATHERDFALFVERKFRNDGLPATRVMFRQPVDPAKGVVPRVAG